MDDFTHRYAAAAPAVDLTDLPHWDLWADRLSGRIGEGGLDEATHETMHAKRDAFVAEALRRLSD
jgi:hypothetical protein